METAIRMKRFFFFYDMNLVYSLIYPDNRIINNNSQVLIEIPPQQKISDYTAFSVDEESYLMGFIIKNTVLNKMIKNGLITDLNDFVQKLKNCIYDNISNSPNIVNFSLTNPNIVQLNINCETLLNLNMFSEIFFFHESKFNELKRNGSFSAHFREYQEPDTNSIPDDFLCPLTLQMMYDPVTAPDGKIYEREVIAEWVKKNGTSPLTREPLEYNIQSFRTNWTLKKQIELFIYKQPLFLREQYKNKRHLNIRDIIPLIKRGEFRNFKRIVSENIDLLETDMKPEPYEYSLRNNRLLYFCIGKPEFFEYLCDKGVDVNLPVENSHNHIVIKIIRSIEVSNINDVIQQLETYFRFGGNYKIQNCDFNIFCEIIKTKNTELFYYIMSKDFDIDEFLFSMLVQATELKLFNISRFLIEQKGADKYINNRTYNNSLLLEYVINNIQMFKYFVEHGADVSLKTSKSNYFIHLAVKYNNVELIKYLVELHNNTDLLDDKNRSVIHYINQNTSLNTLKFLINSGALIHINTYDIFECKPINIAFIYCDFKIITYLLNRGSVRFDCILDFKLSYLHNPKLSDDEKKIVSDRVESILLIENPPEEQLSQLEQI